MHLYYGLSLLGLFSLCLIEGKKNVLPVECEIEVPKGYSKLEPPMTEV